MILANTIPSNVLLSSRLLSAEDASTLSTELAHHSQLVSSEIIGLDLPARNRVESLLQNEFLDEHQLRELACEFVEHTLHIYEEQAPRDRHPHQCVEAARQYLAGAGIEGLQAAIKETIPAVWQLHGTVLIAAFEAGMAATFLDYHDAAEMARVVTQHTQRAAHRKEWECRKSDLELMIGREKEATWQLTRIVEILA